MIEDIQRFLIIVKKRSITKAAESLHMTQPALSLAIKRLEKETQKKLFVRTGKQFELSPEGKAFYRIGEKIIELWEQTKSVELLKLTKPVISVGLFDNAALRLAPFFQKQLLDKKYHIEIKIDHSVQLLQDLHYGIHDIGICVLDAQTILPQNTQLLQKSSEQLIPVAAKKKLTDELNNIPFILYKKGSTTRSCIDEVFFQQKIKPTIVAESTSTTFMKELAITGSGVALLPKNVVKEEIKQKKLFVQKLPIVFYRDIGILIRKESTLKVTDLFVKKMTGYFKKE